MDWCVKELAIKGDPNFLKELESIIDKHNPSTNYWARTGHIADILPDLHINSKPYQEVRTFWTKAVFNKNGHLIITERSANDDRFIYADLLLQTFPDKVSGINRISIIFC